MKTVEANVPNVDESYLIATVGAGMLWHFHVSKLTVKVSMCSVTAASHWRVSYGCIMYTLLEALLMQAAFHT